MTAKYLYLVFFFIKFCTTCGKKIQKLLGLNLQVYNFSFKNYNYFKVVFVKKCYEDNVISDILCFYRSSKVKPKKSICKLNSVLKIKILERYHSG